MVVEKNQIDCHFQNRRRPKRAKLKKCSDFNKILYLGVVFHDCQNCDNNFKSVAILKIWGQVAKFQIAVI